MGRFLSRFWRETRAQDLVEYSLAAGMVALAVVAAIPQLTGVIDNVFLEDRFARQLNHYVANLRRYGNRTRLCDGGDDCLFDSAAGLSRPGHRCGLPAVAEDAGTNRR